MVMVLSLERLVPGVKWRVCELGKLVFTSANSPVSPPVPGGAHAFEATVQYRSKSVAHRSKLCVYGVRKAFPNASAEQKPPFCARIGKSFSQRCELTTGRNL
jgi:hypothetical protein